MKQLIHDRVFQPKVLVRSDGYTPFVADTVKNDAFLAVLVTWYLSRVARYGRIRPCYDLLIVYVYKCYFGGKQLSNAPK